MTEPDAVTTGRPPGWGKRVRLAAKCRVLFIVLDDVEVPSPDPAPTRDVKTWLLWTPRRQSVFSPEEEPSCRGVREAAVPAASESERQLF